MYLHSGLETTNLVGCLVSVFRVSDRHVKINALARKRSVLEMTKLLRHVHSLGYHCIVQMSDDCLDRDDVRGDIDIANDAFSCAFAHRLRTVGFQISYHSKLIIYKCTSLTRFLTLAKRGAF